MPNRSNHRVGATVRAGRTSTDRASARATVMAPNQNAARKLRTWAISPVIGYPRPAPTAAVTDREAMARPAFSGANWLRAMLMVTGRRPRPTPCNPRPTTITKKLVDRAETTHPTMTTPRATSMTRRLRGPSARRPMAGVASAPVMRAAVSNHSAVLNDTPSVRAIVGMSGAPRLLTMATSAATVTRVSSVARSCPAAPSDPAPIPTLAAVAMSICSLRCHHTMTSKTCPPAWPRPGGSVAPGHPRCLGRSLPPVLHIAVLPHRNGYHPDHQEEPDHDESGLVDVKVGHRVPEPAVEMQFAGQHPHDLDGADDEGGGDGQTGDDQVVIDLAHGSGEGPPVGEVHEEPVDAVEEHHASREQQGHGQHGVPRKPFGSGRRRRRQQHDLGGRVEPDAEHETDEEHLPRMVDGAHEPPEEPVHEPPGLELPLQLLFVEHPPSHVPEHLDDSSQDDDVQQGDEVQESGGHRGADDPTEALVGGVGIDDGPEDGLGRDGQSDPDDDDDGRMADGEEEPGSQRTLAIGHQLAGHVVDGRDVVGVERVAHPQRPGRDTQADPDAQPFVVKVAGKHLGDKQTPPGQVDADDHETHRRQPPTLSPREGASDHSELTQPGSHMPSSSGLSPRRSWIPHRPSWRHTNRPSPRTLSSMHGSRPGSSPRWGFTVAGQRRDFTELRFPCTTPSG